MGLAERESQEKQHPHVPGAEWGSANISAAEDLLVRARAGDASIEEINEMVKTLQRLQGQGHDSSVIRGTLAGLIAARTTLEDAQ